MFAFLRSFRHFFIRFLFFFIFVQNLFLDRYTKWGKNCKKKKFLYFITKQHVLIRHHCAVNIYINNVNLHNPQLYIHEFHIYVRCTYRTWMCLYAMHVHTVILCNTRFLPLFVSSFGYFPSFLLVIHLILVFSNFEAFVSIHQKIINKNNIDNIWKKNAA